MQRPFHIDQALLAGPAKRCAVGVGGAEVGVPGVQMRVEMQHGDLSVVTRQRRRIGNAMVWSPPIVNTVAPSRRRSVIDESMVAIASSMSNGLTAMSPASTTC